MADPISIIATTSAIAGIIDILGKTVGNLRELHNQWKESDFTLVNLISQLTALRAGLHKVQEWMDVNEVEPHHQLTMDLEVSISCCRVLITKIDSHVLELRRDVNNMLDFESKMKLVFKNGTLRSLQNMLERQTTALTFLITACNCKAISEQKIWLEKSASRKVFQRVRDDSSSLYVQRDSSSMFSRWTGVESNMSKISKIFDFDRELFVTKVYERVIRNSLKDTVKNQRQQQPQDHRLKKLHVIPTGREINRSQGIDGRLLEDNETLGMESKVLILGDPNYGNRLVRQMRIIQNGITIEELALYRLAIQKNILDIMNIMVSLLERASIELDETLKTHAELLSQETQKIQHSATDIVITTVAAEVVQELWTSEQFQEMFFNFADGDISDPAHYFIEEIHRIAREDYIPTEHDILKVRCNTAETYETRFPIDKSRIIHRFLVLGQQSKKLIQFSTDVTSILFCVDLSYYDKQNLEEPNCNKMAESIILFDLMVNSGWLRRTSIILLLCNVERLKQMLGLSPMSNYFPDYSGGNDVHRASEYFRCRFTQVNRAQLTIYSFITDDLDAPLISSVVAAINETTFNNILKDSGVI